MNYKFYVFIVLLFCTLFSLNSQSTDDVKVIGSSDGSLEMNRINNKINSLEKDDGYFIVTGKNLKEISEYMNGESIRIDGILLDLAGGGGGSYELFTSKFETRDKIFPFRVAFSPTQVYSDNTDIREVRRQKDRVKELGAGRAGSRFRLYGRWYHKDRLFYKDRILVIDKWLIVQW